MAAPDASDRDGPQSQGSGRQGSIDALIRELAAESMEDSFGKLGRADDFYYSGPPEAALPRPFTRTEMILGNRRFAKLYEDLTTCSQDACYAHLSRALARYVQLYGETVELYRLENRSDPAVVERLAHCFLRISEVRGKQPTLEGTTLAAQSIVLLAALCGQERMLADIRALAEKPFGGIDLDASDHSEGFPEKLAAQRPLLPEDILAQALFLMAQNADPDVAAHYGLDVGRVLTIVRDAQAVVDEEFGERPAGPVADMGYRWKCASRVVKLASYRARRTQYDSLVKGDFPPADETHGFFEIEFLTTPDWSLARAINATFLE
jgi:hypothetical protein